MLKTVTRVQNVIGKDLYAICSYSSLQKVDYVPLYTFHKATGLYITLRSSSARLDGIHPVQIYLIGIRHSPDLRSVRNKEVKFIRIYSRGQHLVSIVRIRESPYYRGFLFYRKCMRILSGDWKLKLSTSADNTLLHPPRSAEFYISYESRIQ